MLTVYGMRMIESVYLNFSAYVFHINTNLSNSHASSASAESPLIGDNKRILFCNQFDLLDYIDQDERTVQYLLETLM